MWPLDTLQVVGHTPLPEVLVEENLISCDTFSTYSDGTSIGIGQLIILDTQTRTLERFPYSNSI